MKRNRTVEEHLNSIDYFSVFSEFDYVEPVEVVHSQIVTGQSVFLDAYRKRSSQTDLAQSKDEEEYEYQQLDNAMCNNSEENFLGFLRLSSKNMAALERAKTVCNRCPDRVACLEIGKKHADKHFNQYAIYGGMIVKDILQIT